MLYHDEGCQKPQCTVKDCEASENTHCHHGVELLALFGLMHLRTWFEPLTGVGGFRSSEDVGMGMHMLRGFISSTRNETCDDIAVLRESQFNFLREAQENPSCCVKETGRGQEFGWDTEIFSG